MSGFSPARSPNDNADANTPRFDLDELADRAENRLREYLNEHMDREPTEDEVEWVRAFPRRMAGGRDPRPPTITEMRREFGWGPSNSQKERWGEDFTEQQTGSPDLGNR